MMLLASYELNVHRCSRHVRSQDQDGNMAKIKIRCCVRKLHFVLFIVDLAFSQQEQGGLFLLLVCWRSR